MQVLLWYAAGYTGYRVPLLLVLLWYSFAAGYRVPLLLVGVLPLWCAAGYTAPPIAGTALVRG